MGYDTRYELIVSPHPDDMLDARLYTPGSMTAHALYGWGPMKWYDHDRDMLTLSQDYPDYLFTLEGWGEDERDIWRKYYKGGKMYHIEARIVFDEFDESMLKEANDGTR